VLRLVPAKYRPIVVVVGVVVALIAGYFNVSRRPPAQADDWAAYDKKPARVDRVVDGDTLDLDVGGREVKVRLLGIDTPEMTGPAKEFGAAAKRYAEGRVSGRDVTLNLDEQATRDKYGRLLAYVYLGNEMLNEALVRDGQAFAYRPVDCQFLDHFVQVEQQARTQKRGLWRSITREQMPEWRQRYMEKQGIEGP